MKLRLISILLFTGIIAQAQDKAIDYKELKKIMPSSLMGYSLSDDVEGNSFEMNGMSYSSASANYEKGEADIEVAIMDYQGAQSLYSSTAMAWGMGMKFEDDEQKAYGVEMTDANGWLVYLKEDRTSELIAGYKERYVVTIKASNAPNETFAQEIFKKLNLSSLP